MHNYSEEERVVATYHSRHINPTRRIITPTINANPTIIPMDTPAGEIDKLLC